MQDNLTSDHATALACSAQTSADNAPTCPRLQRLRAALLRAPYRLCIQKAELMTDYLRAHQLEPRWMQALDALYCRQYLSGVARQARGERNSKVAQQLNRLAMQFYAKLDPVDVAQRTLDLAHAFAHTLMKMPLTVYDDELIVGNLTSSRIGAPLHPDFSGLLLAAELDQLGQRETNPIGVDDEQRRVLRERVFPFWFRRSVVALTPLFSRNAELSDRLTEGSAFILTQFAGISHLTPDYPSVLRRGLRGLLAEVEERQETLTDDRRDTQRAFYAACRVTLQAGIDYARRWRRHLLALAATESEPQRQHELFRLGQCFARVPEFPAETFHEALQSLFITHVMVHQESFQHGVSFGRLDQYLLPYYLQDLDSGRLSREHAVELVGCFLGKCAEILPLFFDRASEYFSGLSSASGITLGGRTGDGRDAANDLSLVILDAYDQLRLRQPNLHARIHPDSDATFKQRCYAVLKRGGGMPAFFNDDAIEARLRSSGISAGDAREYSVVGCAEWSVPHKSFPAAGAGFINLASALQLALHNGMDGPDQRGPRGEVANLRSLDQLIEAWRTQLRALLTEAVEGNNAIERVHAQHRETPFLSTLVDGCLARGVGINAGGARYNSTGFQGVGLADVVDSLRAIAIMVFAERRLTLCELVAACDRDFSVDQALHQRLLRRVPKFGDGDPGSAALAEQLSAIFDSEVAAFTNPRGGMYRAGLWSMTTHQGFGRRLGALPSGRRAGEPLANGISPSGGNERRGPTAALCNAAAVAPMANGCVLNQRISPEFAAGARGDAIIDALLGGFFAQGGQQLQFNILDPQVLLAAKNNPEQYRDLVVRISGYSAYFVDLTPAMQDEIIARTAHDQVH